ncbi:MAG: hypothetical protein KAJ51_01180, partial [Thermoplasmata archaeon]|nr:hypothetical protein [Thermoplasmata archaeon]
MWGKKRSKVKDARNIATDVLKSADDDLKKHLEISKIIKNTNLKIKNIKSKGIIVSDQNIGLKAAKSALKSRDFTNAKEIAEAVEVYCTYKERQYNELNILIKEVSDSIATAKTRDCKIEELQNSFKKASKMMKTGEYIESINLLTDISNKANARLQMIDKVVDILKSFNAKAEEAKEINCNVNAELKLIEQAKQALNSGDSQRANELASQALQDIEKHVSDYEEANQKINDAKMFIENIRSEGCDPQEAQKILEDAENALISGDYVNAQVLTEAVMTKANERVNTYRDVSQKLQELEVLKLEASNKTIPIPEDLINRVNSAFQTHNYENTLELINLAITQLKKLIELHQQANEIIVKCSQELENVKEITYTTDIEALLDDAKAQFVKKEYELAASKAQECLEVLTDLLKNGQPIISIALPSEGLKKDIWNRSAITITNSGKVHAKKVCFEIISQKVSIEGTCYEPLIHAGESVKVEVALKSQEEGSIPVELKIEYIPANSNEIIETKSSLWLTVGGTKDGGEETEVKVLRETEYFKGFIRVKAAVENKTTSVITDAALELIADKNIYRLDHIEPDYLMRGDKIHLGNINPNERKTVAIYFDPMMCSKSFLDGSVSNRDAAGNYKTTTMSSKELDVVCPIFFTEESANPAMLRNLLENVLSNKDSKIFNIPFGIKPERAFNICKEMIQGRDIKFIRDYTKKEPYHAEAWYYGVTKVKKYQIVIWASIRAESNSIEISAASSEQGALTGLLAEL